MQLGLVSGHSGPFEIDQPTNTDTIFPNLDILLGVDGSDRGRQSIILDWHFDLQVLRSPCESPSAAIILIPHETHADRCVS